MIAYAAAAGPLWAVTSYFNPVGYRRRRENYRTFREQLAVPLAAVEVSHTGRFELRPEDAEILIQIHGRDVMWQKERLLNIGIAALPASCTQVAILDCDVVFCRPDWPQALSEQLERCPLAQPFGLVHYTPLDMRLDDPNLLAGDYTRPSVAALLERGRTPWEILGHFAGRGPGTRATGHAIAGRRDWLLRHGLYDANILGSGDTSLLVAVFGFFERALQYQTPNRRQIRHYRAWAEPLHRDLGGATLGCVAGDLVHLWHGDMQNRRTCERHRDLAAFDFDPATDIALEDCGCWRWNSDKPAMHAYVRDYFATRQEDGPAGPETSAPPVASSAWNASATALV